MDRKDVAKFIKDLSAADINKILKSALTLKDYTAVLGEMINTCIELNHK
jgi:hypothetical protein